MAERSTGDAVAFQHLRDNLPEEEKKGNMGRILSYIENAVQFGWIFREAQANLGKISTIGQHLDEMRSILQRLTEDGKEVILEALDYQKKNCTEEMNNECYNHCGATLEELWDNVAKGEVESHEKTKKLILKSIENYHRQQCNRVIQNMVQGSAYVAVFQLVKIYMAWKKISSASNLIQDTEKFELISKNLKKMENMVAELLDIHETNPNDESIFRRVMRINTLFTTTLGKISDVRVNINGHIQQLDLVADYSAVDGVVNVLTAGSQGLQICHAWNQLTSFTKFIGVASVAVFLGLGASNFTVFYLSRETLKDLRKDLRDVMRLQEALEDLHSQVEEVISESETNRA